MVVCLNIGENPKSNGLSSFCPIEIAVCKTYPVYRHQVSVVANQLGGTSLVTVLEWRMLSKCLQRSSHSQVPEKSVANWQQKREAPLPLPVHLAERVDCCAFLAVEMRASLEGNDSDLKQML